MDKVYGTFCEMLGEKKRATGKKLVHYYELLNNRVLPALIEEGSLRELVNKEVTANGFNTSDLLTAQTFLWHIRRLVENNATDQITIDGRRFWLYAPGENAVKWEEFYRDGVMGLGWKELGDLRQYSTSEEIKTALSNGNPDKKPFNKSCTSSATT